MTDKTEYKSGVVKVSGRYQAYSTLVLPIGRTPDEQHAHEPTKRTLEAGQVYTLTYNGRTLGLRITRFMHHLAEFYVWDRHTGSPLGAAALPRRWIYHMLDHRTARLEG